jgi:hypothetical protein
MLISDHEIHRTLRLLKEGTRRTDPPPPVDDELNRMVFSYLETLPDVRKEKVRFLRAAIRSSRYYVPEEKVAEKMIGRCLADHLR